MRERERERETFLLWVLCGSRRFLQFIDNRLTLFSLLSFESQLI